MRYLVLFFFFISSFFLNSCGGNKYENIQSRPSPQVQQRDTVEVNVYNFTHYTDNGESIYEVPVTVKVWPEKRMMVLLGKGEKESPYNTFSFVSDYENSSEGGVSIATLVAQHAPQGVLPMYEGKAVNIGFKEFDGKIVAIFINDRLYFNTDIPKIALPRKPVSERKVPGYQPTDVHKVRNGETLSMISRKYNVTIEFLQKKNNLSSTTITPGQEIYIR